MDHRFDGFVREEVAKTAALLDALLADPGTLAAVGQIAELCVTALRAGRKILFAGNGGSAADAQHLAAELVGKLAYDRPGLAAMSLTTDTSILTAVANDYGYEDTFARQVDAVGATGDVLVGISTSGRSRNVLKAFAAARAKGIATIGMTGRGGGDFPPLCDLCLCVPSAETQKIQEAHIVLGHIFCAIVERQMFPRVP
ncbi:MAG TPA: D-sedoheptulose 7-phosphate isomerase [Stellaceae bacterium]|nr:D-sedoheptulose 7-phosphate isomerase [Stellaceae bacterium]